MRPRIFFMPDRLALAFNLRSMEPRVGFVLRRGGGGGLHASCNSSERRFRASSRFRSWERCLLASNTITPSLLMRRPAIFFARAFICGGTDGEFNRSNLSCTLVATLLTFWPPGPAEWMNCSTSSQGSIMILSLM